MTLVTKYISSVVNYRDHLSKVEDSESLAETSAHNNNPFHMLPARIIVAIFRMLDKENAIKAIGVCREWAILNIYPLGHILFRHQRVCEIIRPLFPEICRQASYEELEKNKQIPLLTDSQHHTAGQLKRSFQSATDKFLKTDPINPSIEYGIKGIQQEMKADSLLKRVVDEVVKKEKETTETHTPFYHSMNTLIFLFGYAVKRYLSTMNAKAPSEQDPLKEKYERIHWFRFPQGKDSKFLARVSDFPTDKMEHPIFDDHALPIKNWVLSVNPSLFTNGWTCGEGTWDLFITNKSIYPPSGETFFNLFCDHFCLLPDPALRKTHATCFENFTAEIQIQSQRWVRKQRTPEQRSIEFEKRGNRDLGALFQILVPQWIVNEIAYPCREYGVPKEHLGKTMADVAADVIKNPHNNYTTQGRMMMASVIHPDNQVLFHAFGSPEFLSSLEGEKYVKEFDCFFLEILADSVRKN